MSQTKKRSKYHRITVRNKPGAEDQLTTGANTQLLLDGEPLKGARFIKVEIGATKVAKVLIEMYATVDIDINQELELKDTRKTGFKIQGEHAVVHTLSNLEPTAIAKKDSDELTENSE